MRLGVLLDRFDPHGGGAEAHTAALIRRALAAGDDVVLATLDGTAPEGARTLLVRAPRARPARDRVFAAEGAGRLRDAGCDVVLGFRHCPGVDVYLPHGGLVTDAVAAHDEARGGVSALRRRARDLSGKHRFFLEAEWALLASADGPRVICVSAMLAARVAEVYPASRSRIAVVSNGVDGAHFDPAVFAEAGRAWRKREGYGDAYLGLLLAHNPTLKGVETARAASRFNAVRQLDPPFALAVVSGGIDDPRPLYAAADVLVHPTYHDPCSLACLEALAMGVPVITTPRNGVAELMGAKGGIVIEEPGNPEALATALAVLADPDLRAATAADARDLALRHPLSTRLDVVLDVCRGV